jgi:hypothetical protein
METGVGIVCGAIVAVVAVWAIVHAIRSNEPSSRIASPEGQRAVAGSSASPLSGKVIFWAVFGALWAFSISAGLIVLIFRAITAALS